MITHPVLVMTDNMCVCVCNPADIWCPDKAVCIGYSTIWTHQELTEVPRCEGRNRAL